MQRIAIVGSGIAGLGAAWLLQEHADITVFEANSRPGGHVNTIDVNGQPVDTGFIVLNDRNYPCLTRFLAELGVAVQPSDMSFGVSINRGAIEWAGDDYRALFANPRLLADRGHWRMLADILRFNRQAKRLIDRDALPDIPLGAFLDANRYSHAFAARYLLPMAAAIWSAPTAGMRDFPVAPFLRFFDHHGLLDLRDRPQWQTVVGGSRRYVDAVCAQLGARLRLNTPVTRVTRDARGVWVEGRDSDDRFDQIIFACHADTTTRLLADADADERAILGAFGFQPNRGVLHSDSALMPRRRRAWSSWNYLADRAEIGDQRVAVTYWMNRLQAIPGDTDYFVTLNPVIEPVPECVIQELAYDHPVFDTAAVAAQKRLARIQGRSGAWHCGAWCGHGFHEDGLAAATRVVEQIGIRAPWSPIQSSAA